MPWQTGGIPQLLQKCFGFEFLKGYDLFVDLLQFRQ